MAEPSEQLRAFRARFAGLEEDERRERAARSTTPEQRLAGCIELHALNLCIAIERVISQLGTTDPAIVLPEVNRQRLADSPMPRSLAARRAELGHERSTRSG